MQISEMNISYKILMFSYFNYDYILITTID